MLPPPTDVRAQWITRTSIRVTWEPPSGSGIVGYRIFYNMYAVKDMDKWQHAKVGDLTSIDIPGLEPNKIYVIRVQAKDRSGNYGELSSISVTPPK